MSPKVPAEYEAFRRKEILKAAWELIAERGFQATTMRDLAARIGVSTGVVYTYFTGKEEILSALQQASLARNTALLEELGREQSLRQALKHLLDDFAQGCQADPIRRHARGNVAMIAEALRRDDVKASVTSLYRNYAEGLARLARDGQRRGEFRGSVDADAFARFVMALFLGLQAQAALLDDFDPKPYLDQVRTLLLENIWPTRDSNPPPASHLSG